MNRGWKRRARRAGWWLGGALLAGMVLAASAWFLRLALAERVFRIWAEQAGMEEATIRFGRLDLSGMEASGLRIRRGPLTIAVEELSVDYRLSSWWRSGSVDRALIDGLEIVADLRQATMEEVAGAAAGLMDGEGEGFPFGELQISRAALRLLLPDGEETLPLTAEAQVEDGVRLLARFSLGRPDLTARGELLFSSEDAAGRIRLDESSFNPGSLLALAGAMGIEALKELPVQLQTSEAALTGRWEFGGGSLSAVDAVAEIPWMEAQAELGRIGARNLRVKIRQGPDAPLQASGTAQVSVAGWAEGWQVEPVDVAVMATVGRVVGRIERLSFAGPGGVEGELAVTVAASFPPGRAPRLELEARSLHLNLAGRKLEPMVISGSGWTDAGEFAIDRVADGEIPAALDGVRGDFQREAEGYRLRVTGEVGAGPHPGLAAPLAGNWSATARMDGESVQWEFDVALPSQAVQWQDGPAAASGTVAGTLRMAGTMEEVEIRELAASIEQLAFERVDAFGREGVFSANLRGGPIAIAAVQAIAAAGFDRAAVDQLASQFEGSAAFSLATGGQRGSAEASGIRGDLQLAPKDGAAEVQWTAKVERINTAGIGLGPLVAHGTSGATATQLVGHLGLGRAEQVARLEQRFDYTEQLEAVGTVWVDDLDASELQAALAKLPGVAGLSISGRIKAVAQTTLTEGVWDASGGVQLIGIRIADTAKEVTIEGIAGEVEFTSMARLETPPRQRLSFERMTAGGQELTNGRVTWRARGANRLEISEAEAAWAGGRVGLDPFAFDPQSPAFASAVVLAGLEMEELQKLAPEIPGRIRGRLVGRIPFRYGPDGLQPMEGELLLQPGTEAILALDEPGWLTGGEAGAGTGAVEEALQSVRVTRLRIHLFDPTVPDRPAQITVEGISESGVRAPNEGVVGLLGRLSGRGEQPVVYPPVNLTVNINGPVEALVRWGLEQNISFTFD
jgi:hypothetical protein